MKKEIDRSYKTLAFTRPGHIDPVYELKTLQGWRYPEVEPRSFLH